MQCGHNAPQAVLPVGQQHHTSRDFMSKKAENGRCGHMGEDNKEGEGGGTPFWEILFKSNEPANMATRALVR